MTETKTNEEIIAAAIVAGIKKALEAPLARIAELEARGPGVEYKGIFAEGTTYQKGSLVTKSGGLWLALDNTGLPPGGNPGVWRMIVKSGSA